MSTNHAQGHTALNRPDQVLAPRLWSSVGKYRAEKGAPEIWGQNKYSWQSASLHFLKETLLNIYSNFNQGVKSLFQYC